MYIYIICIYIYIYKGFPGGASGKESACRHRRHKRQFCSLDQEGALMEEMTIHSSIIAWKIPWAEDPGGYSPWDCKDWT